MGERDGSLFPLPERPQFLRLSEKTSSRTHACSCNGNQTAVQTAVTKAQQEEVCVISDHFLIKQDNLSSEAKAKPLTTL